MRFVLVEKQLIGIVTETSWILFLFGRMDAIFNSNVKSGLLHIDSLEALERKRLLRNVMTTAKRELACK